MKCALSIVLFLIAWMGPVSAGDWKPNGQPRDWHGADVGCSPGAVPEPDRCNAKHEGMVAVCWNDRQTGECDNAVSWCTYKSIKPDRPPNGSNPGNVYVCDSTSFSICRKQNAKACKIVAGSCDGEFPVLVKSGYEDRRAACRAVTDKISEEIQEECFAENVVGCGS